LTIYLILRYFDRKKKDAPKIVIISSGGGDVVTEGGLIDKRSGGSYFNLSEYQGAEIVDAKDVEAYDVSFEPPEKGNFKKVTIICDPKTETWTGFPNSLQYLSLEAAPGLLEKLKEATSEDEVAKLLHLLGTLGRSALLKIGKSQPRLEKYESDQATSVFADILADMGNDEAVNRLLELLDDQNQTTRVKQIAGTSLLRIGTKKSLMGLFRRLTSFEAGSFLLESLSEQINESLINEMINGVAKDVSKVPSRIINLLKLLPQNKLVSLLSYNIKISSNAKAQELIITIFEDLYRSKWVKDPELLSQITSILSLFTWSPLAVSGQVSVAALTSLRGIIISPLTSISVQDRIRLLSPAFRSKDKDVRCTAAQFILELGGQNGLYLVEQAIKNEIDKQTKHCMKARLKVWQKKNHLSIFERIFNIVIPRRKPERVFQTYQQGLVPGFLAHIIVIILSPAFITTFLTVVILSAIALFFDYILFPDLHNTEQNLNLIQDDFDEPVTDRWIMSTSSEVTWKGYVDSQIVVAIEDAGLTDWILLNSQPFTDFGLSVDVNVVDETFENLYGILFHYQNIDNFYYFAISSQGYFVLFKKYYGEWNTLVPQTKAGFLDPGHNSINILYEQGQVDIYVNGIEVVVNLQDVEPIRDGTIGLAAGTYEGKSTFVTFDNFILQILEK
jgi:HEAT repeat protein